MRRGNTSRKLAAETVSEIRNELNAGRARQRADECEPVADVGACRLNPAGQPAYRGGSASAPGKGKRDPRYCTRRGIGMRKTLGGTEDTKCTEFTDGCDAHQAAIVLVVFIPSLQGGIA